MGGADLALAILGRSPRYCVRVAQVILAVREEALELTAIQGAGPCYALRQYGLDPAKVFASFQEQTAGKSPINTLLAAAAEFAREQGGRSLVCPAQLSHEYKLNHATALLATGFRRDLDGLFCLDTIATPQKPRKVQQSLVEPLVVQLGAAHGRLSVTAR